MFVEGHPARSLSLPIRHPLPKIAFFLQYRKDLVMHKVNLLATLLHSFIVHSVIQAVLFFRVADTNNLFRYQKITWRR